MNNRATHIQQEFIANKVIPLFYNGDPEVNKAILEACYKGGLRVLEFTNRGDFAHELFADLNKYARSYFPEMILGAGSVPDAGTASIYIQNGAQFIVAPFFHTDTGYLCNRYNIAWIPGCGTLREIEDASQAGAALIKINPAKQVGGADFIKAIKQTAPWLQLMPSGGIQPTEEDLRAWFDAGSSCVAMGSALISGDLIRNRQFELLEENIRGIKHIVTTLN